MEKITKYFWAIALMALAVVASAQTVDTESLSGRPTFGATGKLFAIHYNPLDGRVEVRLAGSEPVAQVDSSGIEIFGTKISAKQSRERLDFVDATDHFEIRNPIESGSIVEIQVRDKKSKKVETFSFEIKPRD